MATGKNFTPLARWLLEQLDERNESARAASLNAGLDHAAISRIIRGTQPSPETCQRLADYFEVPTELLLTLAGHMPAPEDLDAFARQVAELTRGWTDSERRLALELLRTVHRQRRGQ
jgi:transcriptional regulator with XRE-family HTH domain